MNQYPVQINVNRQIESERVDLENIPKILSDLTKRSFDILAASIGLIILLPIFVLIAILIKRRSPGPVFYWGPRMGRCGQPFRILKFRTMYECPESYKGPRVTCKGDLRITPFGCWLRDTKINELPQLWNVIKGEMSLVGPRPEDPTIVSDWSAVAAAEILSVRPGITSPASVLYHDEEELLSSLDVTSNYIRTILPEKMRLDRLYVRYHSFFSDLDVIVGTVLIIIPRLTKTRIPEGYLYFGPISRLVHRHISWFIVDLLACLGVVSLIGVLWRSQGPLHWGTIQLVLLATLMALLFSGINSITGLNQILWSRAVPKDAWNLAFSSGFVTLLLVMLNHLHSVYSLLPYPPLPTTMLIAMGLIAQLVFMTVRYRSRLLTGSASRWLTWRRESRLAGERVLIVGSGEQCQIATWLLKRNIFRNTLSIVGIVDEADLTKKGLRVDGCNILGTISDIPKLIDQFDIGIIVCAIPNRLPEITNRISEISESANVRLVFLNSLLDPLCQELTGPAADSSSLVKEEGFMMGGLD